MVDTKTNPMHILSMRPTRARQGCIVEKQHVIDRHTRARQGGFDENDMPSINITEARQGCIHETDMPSITTTCARQGCIDENDMLSITTTLFSRGKYTRKQTRTLHPQALLSSGGGARCLSTNYPQTIHKLHPQTPNSCKKQHF